MVFARKVDTTQKPIVDALRKIGAKVVMAFRLGEDFPDLIVGYGQRTILLECKTGKRKPSKGQSDFVRDWPGEAHIVYTPEEAISACMRTDVI